jgi:dTDP-4-amino-4,6-dideoxygalactose transaminase
LGSASIIPYRYTFKRPIRIWGIRKTFPIAERVSNEIVPLQMYPELTEEQIKETVHRIEEFVP